MRKAGVNAAGRWAEPHGPTSERDRLRLHLKQATDGLHSGTQSADRAADKDTLTAFSGEAEKEFETQGSVRISRRAVERSWALGLTQDPI